MVRSPSLERKRPVRMKRRRARVPANPWSASWERLWRPANLGQRALQTLRCDGAAQRRAYLLPVGLVRLDAVGGLHDGIDRERLEGPLSQKRRAGFDDLRPCSGTLLPS